MMSIFGHINLCRPQYPLQEFHERGIFERAVEQQNFPRIFAFQTGD